MERRTLIYLFAFSLVLLIGLFPLSAEKSSIKLNVAVIGKDGSLVKQTAGYLAKKNYLTVVDRHNLSSISEEKELRMAGFVKGLPVKEIKGVDCFIQVKSEKGEISAAIVKIDGGRVIGAYAGTFDEVLAQLVDRLEAESGLRYLASLAPGRSAIKVHVEFAKKRFKVGDPLSFKVKASEECYLYVIDVQPGGDMVLLVPNAAMKEFPLKAGVATSVPSEGFKFVIDKPAGIDTIRVIVTRKPVDFFKIHGLVDTGGISTVKEGYKNAFAKGVTLVISRLGDSDWGAAAERIEVFE